MIVDCMTCPVRGQRCDDCAVMVLLEPGWAENLTSAEVQLDAAESKVVSILVGAGLVDAGSAASLRARRDSLRHGGTVRDVG
jgi:hypothetical protein